MTYRVQLGPIPCDVTDIILSALNDEARILSVTLSKAFSVYFWARLADKYDVRNLMGWMRSPTLHLSDQRASEIADAIHANPELLRWCRESQQILGLITSSGLRMNPILLDRLFPKSIPIGMAIRLPYIPDDVFALRRPSVDATACMRVTLDSLPYAIDEFKAAWIVSLVALMLKIPTFSLFAVQDRLAGVFIGPGPDRTNAKALMHIFKHPDFDPSASNNAWLMFTTKGDATYDEHVKFLVSHPKFQTRFLTARLAARFLESKWRRSMFRALFVSDKATWKRWYNLDYISLDMGAPHIGVLVVKFPDVIPEEDRNYFALRLIEAEANVDEDNGGIADNPHSRAAFERLREWGTTPESVCRDYEKRHGHAYSLRYRHYRVFYRHEFIYDTDLVRIVTEDEHTYAAELHRVLEDTDYPFHRYGYAVLSKIIDRALETPRDAHKAIFEMLSKRRENGFDSIEFVKYIATTRPGAVDLFREWTTRKSKRIAKIEKKRKRAPTDSSSESDE